MIVWLITAGMVLLVLQISHKLKYARDGTRTRDIEDLEWSLTWLTLIFALILLGLFL